MILTVDQGTTSTRALMLDANGRVRATAQRPLAQSFPAPGLVEHDPEEIWDAVVAVTRQVLSDTATAPKEIAAIGITNQRETTVIWDRRTGAPIHPAVVWQDRRTAEICAELRDSGHSDRARALTGLEIDPYFSATKIAWILDRVDGARARAERGELAFGTIDSFLIWRLTGGLHRTDATNASRSLLFDLRTRDWSAELLDLFRVPAALVPSIVDCAGVIGTTDPKLFGAAVPIAAAIGDQQSAAVGQACLAPGAAKCTYGTGAFMLSNAGNRIPESTHRLLATLALQVGDHVSYALEGSIFVAGAALQWLRDGLGLFQRNDEIDALARRADPDGGVQMAPAFVGLGAPWWDADARGAIFGLTRDTGAPDLVRAALDAACHQTADLITAMTADGAPISILRVDGGMTNGDWFVQRLADLTGIPIERPTETETTALGAGWLAGSAVGLLPPVAELSSLWRLDRRFDPAMSEDRRAAHRAAWLNAIGRVRSAPSSA